jgi:hypothetical protein
MEWTKDPRLKTSSKPSLSLNELRRGHQKLLIVWVSNGWTKRSKAKKQAQYRSKPDFPSLSLNELRRGIRNYR